MKNYHIKVLEKDAVKNIKEGKIKNAEGILEKILLVNDNNTTALNLLALCKYIYCKFNFAHKLWTISYEKDKNSKAKHFLEMYDSVDEIELRKLYRMCLLKIKSGNHIAAREDLTKVIAKNSILIPPKILLASLELEIKNSNKFSNNISSILATYKIDESNIENNNLYISKLEEIILGLKMRQFYLAISTITLIIIILILILMMN